MHLPLPAHIITLWRSLGTLSVPSVNHHAESVLTCRVRGRCVCLSSLFSGLYNTLLVSWQSASLFLQPCGTGVCHCM